ncbi:MAG: hypothetical protein AABW91_01945 [Nanoarchaeota archaeon]
MEGVVLIYSTTIILLVILLSELLILSNKISSNKDKDRKEIKKAVKN